MELHIKNFQFWLNNPSIGEATRQELVSICNDESEIKERFHKDLEFGTGGIRGIIGAGTNRMNIYVVRRAAQGLSDYILATVPEAVLRGVCISYDNRRYSREFAMETALIVAQNGIKAYVFDKLTPTPILSFAVRKLGCIAGVMITASHNPPEYNGFKAYWEDGGQMAHPQDEDVIAYVNKIDDPASLTVADEKSALDSGLLEFLGNEIYEKYFERLKELCINPVKGDFTIVYSPFYGCGNEPVQRALRDAGFEDVHVVKEQAGPDPDFPTLAYPNPEDPAAFELAIKLAKAKNADIIIANDPDADRVGAMVKNARGEYELISGNAVGVLLTEYILSHSPGDSPQTRGTVPYSPPLGVISTFVSTRLTQVIAEHYGAGYVETFTGYKNIAKEIRGWETSGEYNYVFGFEESFGYLAGDFVRDKDGVSAALLICEVAAFFKQKGKTLFDALNDIYEKYGYFKETTVSITLPGLDGAEKIRQMMALMRQNPPAAIAEATVVDMTDYANHSPPSNMLYFTLADESWFCARPSGTEPKIKIYIGVKESSAEKAEKKLQTYSEILRKFF